MTQAEMKARIEELEGKLAKRSTIKLKVSEKGAVSMYGIRRFPVTFYADEWARILGNADQVTAFVEANRSKLSFK